MSTLLAPVAIVDAITPHGNADTLELAQVLGWQLVVKKGQYVPGDRVVYFCPDTILPLELSDKIGVTQYLDKGRIRCTRLRGEPSFGLAITPDDPTWEIGQNVAEYYGASKWEPPLRSYQGQRGGLPPDALPEHPLFPRYTTIENMRNYPTIFEDGEMVAITEKIHGANCRVGIVEGELMSGSHKLRRKSQEDILVVPLYWFPLTLGPVRELLVSLSSEHKQVVLYGEIYGSTIQSLHYGYNKHLGFRAFDLLIDGKFLNISKFYAICAYYGVARVPLLDTCPFSLSSVKALSEGPTTLLDGKKAHIREGVVVKPLYERTHPKVGRCVLKYISDTYLLAKKTDFAEE